MKAVSKHIEHMFMKKLVTYSRDNGYRPIDVHEDALSDLKCRPDFDNVITFLHVKGYLETDVYDGEIWFITLSEKGVSYFEDERDFISERRWTRGLAIAALILSVISIVIAGLSLYLQWRR